MKFTVTRADIVGQSKDGNIVKLEIETETGTIRAKVLESKVETPELVALWVSRNAAHAVPSKDVIIGEFEATIDNNRIVAVKIAE